jgi:hypothetical protein
MVRHDLDEIRKLASTAALGTPKGRQPTMYAVMIIAIAALALSASAASAAQFRSNLNPGFSDLGVSLQARRIIEGLTQGQNVAIHLLATAQVTVSCVNPNNDHTSPPQGTPAPIAVTGFQNISAGLISEQGRTLMNLATAPPPTVIAGSPDCKAHDVEEITDLSFARARIIVEQPTGNQVLEARCRINPPSANGAVPAGNVSCVKG